MKTPGGKALSPLDQIRPRSWSARFTEELLEPIEVLERTVELNRERAILFEEVLASPLFTNEELGLGAVPDELRNLLRTPCSPHRRRSGAI